MAQGDPGCKVCIGRLPADISVEELRIVFRTYGEVVDIQVHDIDPAGGYRTAFILYNQPKAASDAVTVLHEIYKIREDAREPITAQLAENSFQPAHPMSREAPYPAGQQQPEEWSGGPGQQEWSSGPGPQEWAGAPSQQEWSGAPPQQEWAGSPSQQEWTGGPNQQGPPASGISSGWGGGQATGPPPSDGGWGGQSASQPAEEEHKLFVGLLPADISEEELKTVFGTYGQVIKVVVMKPNQQGLRGALVFYATRQAGEDAIKVLNGVYKIRLDAKDPIQVRWGRDNNAGAQSTQSAPTNLHANKLFVGNLPSEVTEEDIQMVFKTYGEIDKIVLMAPHAQTNLRAALVFYTNRKSGDDAIQLLHDTYKFREDSDQAIQVKWGKDNPNSGWGGGGGGQRGGWNSNSWGDSSGKDSSRGWSGGGGGGGGGWQEAPVTQQVIMGGTPVPLQCRTEDSQGSWDGGWQGGGNDSSWNQSGGSDWRAGGDAGGGAASWGGGGDSWDAGWGARGGKDGYGKGGGDSKGDYGKGNGKGDCKGGGGAPPGDGGKLYVANLPEDIQESALEYVFNTYGKVQKVHIMTGKVVNGSVAGFVEYSTPAEAETAIASLNEKYEIRPGYGPLVVRQARARQERSRPY